MSYGSISEALGYPGHSIADALEKGGAIGGGPFEVIDCSGYGLNVPSILANGGQTIESLEIADKIRAAYSNGKPVIMFSGMGVFVGNVTSDSEGVEIDVSALVPMLFGYPTTFVLIRVNVMDNSPTVTFIGYLLKMDAAPFD